jgi:hypothetical protein
MPKALEQWHRVLYWEVGNFLGVSGPLPLQGTCRTDSSPGNYIVEVTGNPVAELENIRVTVCEFVQNQQTHDLVTVELDVISRGYTTDPPQPPVSDPQHPAPLPMLSPRLGVDFRNLARGAIETVWFPLQVHCSAYHFLEHRTVSPPAPTGWLQQWAGTSVRMEAQFYPCP